ncbi:MauE/DoxX family redox-associated membrane protein [Actinoplanes sp. NPDC023801]|uniref:MauE/DoxX family redox-associated membrane protein n=1 Tax=Actinoplanes sp. NPDC023801 TaxID=3154595 RepID=UPI0033C69E02
MPYLELGCRALLTTVLAVALAGKIRPAAFTAFAASLAPIRGIPAPARRPLASAIVLAEATAVVLLWTPGTVRAGYLLGALLLTVFTATLAVSRWQGAAVRCRCFGYDAGPVRSSHIIRNLGLVAVAVTGLVSASPAATAEPLLPVAAGALAGLLVTRWDDMAFALSK